MIPGCPKKFILTYKSDQVQLKSLKMTDYKLTDHNSTQPALLNHVAVFMEEDNPPLLWF